MTSVCDCGQWSFVRRRQVVAGVCLQEREQTFDLAAPRAEMDIREKDRSEVGLVRRFEFDLVHKQWLPAPQQRPATQAWGPAQLA